MKDNNTDVQNIEKDIPSYVHILCGYPLIMVFIGGAIGGGLGALAYMVNIMIYKSKLLLPVKIILNVLTGMSAVAIWAIIAYIISS